jgi:hypothetical protein
MDHPLLKVISELKVSFSIFQYHSKEEIFKDTELFNERIYQELIVQYLMDTMPIISNECTDNLPRNFNKYFDIDEDIFILVKIINKKMYEVTSNKFIFDFSDETNVDFNSWVFKLSEEYSCYNVADSNIQYVTN